MIKQALYDRNQQFKFSILTNKLFLSFLIFKLLAGFFFASDFLTTLFYPFIDHFVNNYKCLMAKQKQPQDKKKLCVLKRLIEYYVNIERGKILTSFSKCGERQYSIFYAFDNFQAYYLFGAADRSVQEYYGSFCFFGVFNDAMESKIYKFDLEGINSPGRGIFKQGFGGDIKVYYEINRKFKNG